MWFYLQHFPYVENNDDSGHFKCVGDKTTSDSGLIPVEQLEFSEHHITEDGMMQASYVGDDEENIVQNFSSKEFCLELKQVITLSNLSFDLVQNISG